MDHTKVGFNDFTFTPVCDEHTEEIRKHILNKDKSYVNLLIEPSRSALNQKFVERLPGILDFKVYSDDTWVVTFPKSGTTWTQEMVWLLKNNFDFNKAKTTPIRQRFPFLELEPIIQELTNPNVYPKTIELAAQTTRPRCIKSHLPVALLPRQLWTVKPKIIFVSRDPRDVVVSYYHHHRLWSAYSGSFDKFFDAFINDRVVYSPYWGHLLTWTKLRHRTDHILFNTFEEMKEDLPKIIKRTASFLNVEVTEDNIKKLCQHLSFKEMQCNQSVNYMDIGESIKTEHNISDAGLSFMRSGKSGGWKSVLTEEMIDKMNSWTREWLNGSEFTEYPTTLQSTRYSN